ncbi:MAG: DUF4367 domain-containing protein [Ruminiclostridium sp.]|jgi:hypothetical protein|nr:DUF4367 domain-containing protein [Ruminiclostridium sp.]
MKEFYQDTCFEKLSTEQLEKMIDLGLELPARENRKALLRILEVLEARECDVDVKKAWEEFQIYYNIPEGSGSELYETGEVPEVKEAESAKTTEKSRVVSFPRLRAVGRVAVVAAITFTLMITTAVAAQAAGYDVFGTLGRWTDETFRFEITGAVPEEPTQEQITHRNEFQQEIASIGIAQNLAPSWYPEGFEPYAVKSEGIEGEFDTAWCEYRNKEEGTSYSVWVDLAYNPIWIEGGSFEKDDSPVEKYKSKGRLFYIMSNIDTITATWSNGKNVVTIAGQITTDDIKQIIDSIGG